MVNNLGIYLDNMDFGIYNDAKQIIIINMEKKMISKEITKALNRNYYD